MFYYGVNTVKNFRPIPKTSLKYNIDHLITAHTG